MFLIIIIGMICAFISFHIWGNTYDSVRREKTNNGYIRRFDEKDKLNRPLWAVILLFMIGMIPVANLCFFVFLFGRYVYLLLDNELYFHSDGKIAKLLSKNI